MEEPSAAQLRLSAAIRVLAAVLVAGAVTAILTVATWGPLDVRTDVIGYPIFQDFNYENYFTGYYLVIGFFPIASLLLFLGLTRVGPRIGLPVPPSRGSLRPHTPRADPAPALDGEPAISAASREKRWVVAGARIAFVGAVLGLEAGIAFDSVWLWLALGTAIYACAATLAALAIDRWDRQGSGLEQRLPTVNSIGATLSVAGLIAVSGSTEVKVLSDGSLEHHRWFPAWLGGPIAAALAAWIAIAVRGRGLAGAAAIERRALILIPAPVCLFLLLASLPGEVGIDFFHFGEALVATRLVGDGWLPWRDVVLTHGLLQDVAGPGLSLAVFGDSIWGYLAGSSVLLTPLYFVSQYFLFAYLFGRNWLFLVFTALLVLGTLLAPPNFRFILWPLTLVLLALVLDHPTRARSIGLAAIAVGQTIITPEAAPALLAVSVVLVGYELYDRQPGESLTAAFPRTIWYASAGLALAALFAAYLASRGALDDYVWVSIKLLHGHALSGAFPPTRSGLSENLFGFMALMPIVATLIAFAYGVTRLRLRLRFRTEDWVMAAAALCTVLYFPKFLSRMDQGHVYETYSVALPLALYIVYRFVEVAEGAVNRTSAGRRISGFVAHPVSLALVVLVAVLGWNRLPDEINDASVAYRPAVWAKPLMKQIGYASAVDPAPFRAMERIIDAYLAPGDRLFDFTNEPALFFYLIDRNPSTRYFHATLAKSEDLQRDQIERLRQARPKLIIFDNTASLGLATWDGIPTNVRHYDVSHWILDNYRPLLTLRTYTIYARRDQPPPWQLDLGLTEKPIFRHPEFHTQQCNWQYAPNFFSGAVEPPPGAQSVAARTAKPARPVVTVMGWAGDKEAQVPVREVIAAVGGRIVGRAVPRIERPDLPTGGWPPGFLRSGFRVQVPTAALRKPGELHVYGVARDKSVAEVPMGTAASRHGGVRLGGRTVRLEPTAVSGHVDLTVTAPSLQIVLPPRSQWSDYRWLEIDAGNNGFRKGAFALFDRQSRPSPGREISFQTLDRSLQRYIVPVGSCAQWHGYRSRRLFLTITPHQDIAGVRLIR
jgi:hypothetical protein